MPEPTKRAAPPDPVVAQRMLVYTLTGLLCVTGIILAIAFKDPCARAEGVSDVGLATCQPSISDRMPGIATYLAMGLVFVMMVALYELRWVARVGAVAAIGSIELVIAVLIVHQGMSNVLAIANALIGLSLIACAVGVQRERRIAWSYACAICAISTLVYFFGSSKVRDATGWELAWAVLPALAGFLPVLVALATSPPGGTRYAPFAKVPLAAAKPATARR